MNLNFIKKYFFVNLLFCFNMQANQYKFVFVIASYNNAKWCQKNLESVLLQNYSNNLFRVIYTDDFSSDQTVALVELLVNKLNKNDQFKLIKNNARSYALANYYHMLQFCDDDEIAVMVDGDDWLKHKNVLNILNEIYQNKDIWFTYGRYECMSESGKSHIYGKPFPKEVVSSGQYLEYLKHNQFRATPLRSFRTWLFKSIDKRFFINHNGDFFKTASDVAYVLGMLNIAKDKIYFINEPLYVYNTMINVNDFKINGALKKQEIEEIFNNFRVY